jgi:hypothetical protein
MQGVIPGLRTCIDPADDAGNNAESRASWTPASERHPDAAWFRDLQRPRKNRLSAVSS